MPNVQITQIPFIIIIVEKYYSYFIFYILKLEIANSLYITDFSKKFEKVTCL